MPMITGSITALSQKALVRSIAGKARIFSQKKFILVSKILPEAKWVQVQVGNCHWQLRLECDRVMFDRQTKPAPEPQQMTNFELE